MINPKAGVSKKDDLPGIIEKFCREHGVEHKIVLKKKEDKKDWATQAIKEYEADIVVAGGGDGTVNAVGQVLLKSDTPMGIIPLGSSNALAKNLNIPLATDEALKNILTGHRLAIDTLTINGQPCLHLCDMGFNANLIRRSHKSRVRGMFTYGISLLLELFTFRFFRYRVTTPKEKVEGKAFAITVTNTRFYGSMAAINPEGKIDDGYFEIAIFKPFPRWAMIKMSIQLFRRRIHESPYSMFIRAQSAVIENLEHETVQIDGEPMKLASPLRIEIQPKSLRVIVPGD
jgi:YegS/Rv2252/BmrU family lipid kinase